MTDKKDIKVVFAPGAFDDFDGTQEELDEMMAEIHRLVETGEIFEKSTPMTEDAFEDLDEEVQIKIMQALDILGESEDEDDEVLENIANKKLH